MLWSQSNGFKLLKATQPNNKTVNLIGRCLEEYVQRQWLVYTVQPLVLQVVIYKTTFLCCIWLYEARLYESTQMCSKLLYEITLLCKATFISCKFFSRLHFCFVSSCAKLHSCVVSSSTRLHYCVVSSCTRLHSCVVSSCTRLHSCVVSSCTKLQSCYFQWVTGTAGHVMCLALLRLLMMSL